MKTAITFILISEKKIATWIYPPPCLLCFITIHLPLNRTLESCKTLWGGELRRLGEAVSVIIMAVWGRRKVKNRRARKQNFSGENGDLDSENM